MSNWRHIFVTCVRVKGDSCQITLYFDLESLDPQGQIQAQSRGQRVIKPKKFPTKKSNDRFGKLVQFPFPKTQISTNLTQW